MKKITKNNILILLFLTLTAGISRISADEISDRGIEWLKSQIVPNETVKNPVQQRRRLLLSYKLPETDPAHRFLAGKSFIYDDALAVIAFTMTDNYEDAEFILSAMNRNMKKDGSLWFSYNTNNEWPSDSDNEGAVVRSGALAWAGYSAVYYLTVRKKEIPDFLATDVIAGEFLHMAEKIAGYLKDRQITDRKDKRFGLITGGSGNYELVINTEKNTVDEVFSGGEIDWVSMEHNIDAFYLFRDLGRLTGSKVHLDTAALIEKSLMDSMWDRKNSQFFRGIKGDGKEDRALPLDGASWGSLFLSSIGESGKARKSLDTIEKNFRTNDRGFTGYGPYHDELIYENPDASLYLTGSREKTWKEAGIVWSEGTLGAAAAYIRAGETEKGREIISNAGKMAEDGGLIYSSTEIPFHFSSYPCAAGTAWYIIAQHILENPDDIFWGK
jgi:hypothetical protein